MRSFLIFFFTACLFNLANAQQDLDALLKKYNTGEVPYISVEELRMQQLKGEVTILDAREPQEYVVSHLEDAYFVGYEDFEVSRLADIPKDKPIVVYCSLGIRSEDISTEIQKAGFRNIRNLYGGIFEWKNKGFPVIDSNGKETERVHAFSQTWGKWLKNAEKVY
ncbi:hypothetical protein GCM10023115_31260 [Pontixanthobacter gangjinensis]|uniref:rhodanese-like domain-containing protein n=1 Tax=Christiangramia aestuarii TaxID=1028746 RepID=UPI001EE4AAC7|nr:rhodanese-like domain-containing protein [Christiangramia aestuarii]